MVDPLYLFIFTTLASTEGFIVAVAIIIAGLMANGRNRIALIVFLTSLGLTVSVELLKQLLKTPRPGAALIEVTGYAFPSAHAAGVVFLGLTLIYLSRHQKPFFWYGVLALCVGLMLAIGISRFALGVHTLLQVTAGYLLGILWTLVLVATIKKWGE